MYTKYTAAIRYETGKYASETGDAVASRKFRKKYHKLNESTVREFRKEYKDIITKSA